MNAFIKYLQSIYPISQSAIDAIQEVSEFEVLPKKNLLIQELSKSNHLYFISKGVVRAFFYHEDKEITDWFGMENMIIGPIIRNFPVKDTIHSVETLEITEVVKISFENLESLYARFHEIERLGRMIAINTILHLQNKIDSLQLLSAKERYIDFNIKYPGLIQRVNLGYISSYLNMNQVTLSKIRKELSNLA